MQEAVPAAAADSAAAPQKLIAGLRLPALSLPALSCGCASERQLFNWLAGYEL